MKTIKPDIIAKVYFYDARSKEGNPRQHPISEKQYGCPLYFGDQAFDCRLLLDEIDEEIKPGETLANLPIKFLFYDLVKPNLKLGEKFKLWELGFFAEGEILEVL